MLEREKLRRDAVEFDAVYDKVTGRFPEIETVVAGPPSFRLRVDFTLPIFSLRKL